MCTNQTTFRPCDKPQFVIGLNSSLLCPNVGYPTALLCSQPSFQAQAHKCPSLSKGRQSWNASSDGYILILTKKNPQKSKKREFALLGSRQGGVTDNWLSKKQPDFWGLVYSGTVMQGGKFSDAVFFPWYFFHPSHINIICLSTVVRAVMLQISHVRQTKCRIWSPDIINPSLAQFNYPWRN